MKVKGFTLIELLAVIVILAIIAIIATPIILGIIKDTKKEAAKVSVENYLSAVQQAIVTRNLKEEFKPTFCKITKGDLVCDGYSQKLKIETNVKENINGILKFDNGMVINETNFVIGDYIVKVNEKKQIEIKDVLAPVSFASDSWETIVANVRKGNISVYETNLKEDKNNTKKIQLTGELAGTYTVRLANTSTPQECNEEEFSQTACGFVIEFEDAITKRAMNLENTNVGGWKDSELRVYMNELIYNSISKEIKENILETKVVSGYGKIEPVKKNFVTIDKLYLLSPKEVYAVSSPSETVEQTRQLDYYLNKGVTTSNYSLAIKKYNGEEVYWKMRCASTGNDSEFYSVTTSGGWYSTSSAAYIEGVSPAFRIG